MSESNGRKKTHGSAPSQATTARRKRSTVKDPGGSPEARRMAAVILEIWAGVRTTQAAATALSVSLPRFYQLEQRAVGALVASCEPRPRGPGPNLQRQIRSLERQLASSRRDCARLQALLRTSQRALGLSVPETQVKNSSQAKPGTAGKRRPRKPTARALRLAEALATNSPGENSATALEPTGDSTAVTATRVAAQAVHGAEGAAP